MGARKVTDQQRSFIAALHPYTTQPRLATVLGLSVSSIGHHAMLLKVPGRPKKRPPLCERAVAEAWRRWQNGQRIGPDLLAWSDDALSGCVRRHWSHSDTAYLREFAGKVPLTYIAKHLGRTREALIQRLKSEGLKPLTYSMARLQREFWERRRLRIGGTTIGSWVARGKVRSYRDGHLRIIHRDDAEWLLECYQYREGFPRNPGQCDYRTRSAA